MKKITAYRPGKKTGILAVGSIVVAAIAAIGITRRG